MTADHWQFLLIVVLFVAQYMAFWWIKIVEAYALDLHNSDINDIRARLWKLERDRHAD